jgi:ParB family protein of integrating conjugative element (PFGI_1 class)
MTGGPDHRAAAPGSLPSIEERRRLVANSLGVGNPSRLGHTLPEHADPPRECPIELAVDDIAPYEHNPRRAANPRFDDIKESIRTGGLRSPLTVTRRPGERFFVVEAGGNTRLRALKELWAETRDAKFGRLTVLFRPWRGDAQVLSAHLVENEQRGDMSFWDKACGVAALKARLEAERGSTLTLRALEDALHGVGLSITTATLGLYLFATERLRTLGEAFPDLSGLDVKTLQPKLNAIKREAIAMAACTDDEVWEQCFEPALQDFAAASPNKSVSVSAVLEACRGRVESVFGSVASVANSVEDAGSTGDKKPPITLQHRQDPLDFERHLTAFAERTGVCVPTIGTGSSTAIRYSMGPSSDWTSLERIDQATISQLPDPLHRRAWACLRQLVQQSKGPFNPGRCFERPDPSAQLADVDKDDEAGHHDGMAPATAPRGMAEVSPIDVALIAWMTEEDAAAKAFHALVQTLVRRRLGPHTETAPSKPVDPLQYVQSAQAAEPTAPPNPIPALPQPPGHLGAVSAHPTTPTPNHQEDDRAADH